jgi:hypothetical protein
MDAESGGFDIIEEYINIVNFRFAKVDGVYQSGNELADKL